ncbi:voltage-dependent calcium channel subunit alpha-2/delta-3 [Tetranychus urticae]|uniref:VWFA domain-containing protein n=1 Tax=Tetranychus urticae TaxID=32264 RepID=T1KZA7_TETUR|nr:voltage-dependent calcium channel subunit alpha-2/delta-3 [Tetranychus urticae]
MKFTSNLVNHFIIFIVLISWNPSQLFQEQTNLDQDLIRRWANDLSQHLNQFVNQELCYEQINQNFAASGAIPIKQDTESLISEIKSKFEAMFKRKKMLTVNIARRAEELAEKHIYDSNLKFDFPEVKRLYEPDLVLTNLSVPPIKLPMETPKEEEEWRKLWEDPRFFPVHVEPDEHFKGVAVNTKMSAVHLPVNVYYGRNETKNSIKWSTGLDKVFTSNHEYDPDSYWQFYCSIDGFLRIYPLHHWRYPEFFVKQAPTPPPNQPQYIKPLDLYDCRVTQWFIRAAASPKDMVILIDTSGSMKGQRQAIAKEVVVNILDTLTENDFIGVFNYSSRIDSIVDCFKDSLVPASKQNVQMFREAVQTLKVNNQSELMLALTKAYNILGSSRRSGSGAQCNQLIMLVTDGVAEDLQKELTKIDAEHRVRIFTYLVGKEITEIMPTRNLACNNRGRFSHIKDFSDIREHVQQYVATLSRPIVLLQGNKSIEERTAIFTSVYADHTEIDLAPWIWDALERTNIREAYQRRLNRLQEARGEDGNNVYPIDSPEEKDYEDDLEKKIATEYDTVPLRQTRETEKGDEPSNGNKDETKTGETGSTRMEGSTESGTNNGPSYSEEGSGKKEKFKPRPPFDLMTTIAIPVLNRRNSTLLGVAGVDIPITEMIKLIPSYKIGVNGYSFSINNNGFVLYHPDLRTLFQNLLKPYYSSVDILEIELGDNKKEARQFSPDLVEMRKSMIYRKNDCRTVKTKLHIDSMNRGLTRLNKYCWTAIDDTPFIMAIALPETYGLSTIKGQIDATSSPDFNQYFAANDWYVHPDWVYCYVNPRNRGDPANKSINPASMIKMFLNRWRDEGEKAIDWIGSLETNAGGIASTKPFFCDRELIERLIYDAKFTKINFDQCKSNITRKPDLKFIMKLLSTRSGLTRVKLYPNDDPLSLSNLPDNFIPDRSIDEQFYQRSVEFATRYKESSLLFSVPFDLVSTGKHIKDVYISVSKAIFLASKNSKVTDVPVGSILGRIPYKPFAEAFLRSSSICTGDNCLINCDSSEIDCLLLDNNGYIITSDRDWQDPDGLVHYTGLFYGQLDNDLFTDLIDIGLYTKIRIYDYQAICISEGERRSAASSIWSTLDRIKQLITWIIGQFVFSMIKLFITIDWTNHYSHVFADYFLSSDYDTSYLQRQARLDYFNNSAGNLIAPARTTFYPCDKFYYLYEAQNLKKFSDPTSRTYTLEDGCEQNYVVQWIPQTNLILLVSHNQCPSSPKRQSIIRKEVNYESKNPCEKFNNRRKFERKRPESCFDFHKKEFNISKHDCGRGSHLGSLGIIALISWCILVNNLITLLTNS